MFQQPLKFSKTNILASLHQMSKRRQRKFAEEQWYAIVKGNTEDEFPFWLLNYIPQKRWKKLFLHSHYHRLDQFIHYRVGGSCGHSWCGYNDTCSFCARRELLWNILEGDVKVEGGDDLLKPLEMFCPPYLLTAGLMALNRLELVPDLQREVMEKLLPHDVLPNTIYHNIYIRLWELVDANKDKLMLYVSQEEALMLDDMDDARPEEDEPWI